MTLKDFKDSLIMEIAPKIMMFTGIIGIGLILELDRIVGRSFELGWMQFLGIVYCGLNFILGLLWYIEWKR